MKKCIIFAILVVFIASCSTPMYYDGTKYNTYGIINANNEDRSNAEYQVVWGNVVWGVLLFQTIIAPVYFLGFDMYEPVRIYRTPEKKDLLYTKIPWKP